MKKESEERSSKIDRSKKCKRAKESARVLRARAIETIDTLFGSFSSSFLTHARWGRARTQNPDPDSGPAKSPATHRVAAIRESLISNVQGPQVPLSYTPR